MNAQQAKQGTVKREASAQGGNCNQINPIHSVASGNEMRSDNEWKIDWFRADWRERAALHFNSTNSLNSLRLMWIEVKLNERRQWVNKAHSINSHSMKLMELMKARATATWIVNEMNKNEPAQGTKPLNSINLHSVKRRHGINWWITGRVTEGRLKSN